jgi:hypothetical protein
MPLSASITVDSIPEIVERLASKTPVGSTLRTADWGERVALALRERVPLALRERALFSAAVNEINTVASMRELLDEWAAFASRDAQRAFMDRSKFVAEMRGALGAMQGDSGALTDLESRRRLELIYQFQTTDAAEYARFVIGQDAAILDEFPAQELVRVEARWETRDWLARWQTAGGQLFGGRMIARKDAPIWTEISRFGRPWPPFDFGSGMGLRDIERDEAVALGVIRPQDSITPSLPSFNEGLSASVADLNETERGWLKEQFLDQIVIEGDTVKWVTPDWLLESNLRMTPDQLADLIPAKRKTMAIETLARYTNDQYEPINRNPYSVESRNLDLLVRRLTPVTDAPVVWRGVAFEKADDLRQFMAELRQGQWRSPQTLLSATRNPVEAETRAAYRANGVLIEIQSPRTARDMEPLVRALDWEAMASKEREVVFLRGSRFEVVTISEKELPVYEQGGRPVFKKTPYVVLREL